MVERAPPPMRQTPRAELRDELRDDSPLQAAARRANEIMEHGGAHFDDAPDRFLVPSGVIPEGWDYNWKTRTVLNKEDPPYQVKLASTGWVPVPLSRHPEMMPKGHIGDTIEIDGQVLMERPKVISDMVTKRDLKRARDQVMVKELQLGAAPPGQFERQNKDNSMAKIKKSYEPMPIPSE